MAAKGNAQKRSNVRQAVRASGNSGALPGWIWLIVGMLLGLALSALAIWRDWLPGPKSSAGQSASTDEGAPDLSNDTQVISAKPPPAPKPDQEFDFYTVLPEMQVVLPEKDSPKASDAPVVPTALADGRFRFVLQLGSFGNLKDADSLKAKAALAGVQASVQKVSVDDKTFHRVRVGPFASAALLESARAELKLAGLSAVALREKI